MAALAPRFLVRLEGAAAAGAALTIYFHQGYGWLALLVLALAPDVSMGGYAAGPAVGAAVYDLAHTYVFPLVLAALGVVFGSDLAVQLALIWLAHIGLDRLLGYGLKYPTGFKDTHLQRL